MKTRIYTICSFIALFVLPISIYSTNRVSTSVNEDILLGQFPFPTATASLSPTDVVANIQISDLTYTSNLMYDYNTSTGYFRPYKWPEGVKDDATYLEFTLTPNSTMVNMTNLTIVHKPNNATLGPSKISMAYSINGGSTFTSLPEITIATRTAFNTDVFDLSGLNTTQPIIFRLYAFESLYGLETQKDLWIIDQIELMGSLSNITTEVDLYNQKSLNCYYYNNYLIVRGVKNTTNVSVFNLFGVKLFSTVINSDMIIPYYTDQPIVIVNMESKDERKTMKITKSK